MDVAWVLVLFFKASLGGEPANRATVIEVASEAACKRELVRIRQARSLSDGFCCRPASEDGRPGARGGDKPCFRS